MSLDRPTRRHLALALALAIAVPQIGAADDIESRPLRFAKGAPSATVMGTIKGRQTIDYRLRARAGQTMSVTLDSRHAGLAFNVLPPGSKDVAITDAIDRQTWSGVLPADGEYTVRTYLNRAAARRGESASFHLTVAIQGGAASSGAGDARASAATDRAVAGRFDATGQLSCAGVPGQPMGSCSFGVARAGGGTATVAVSLPGGRKRLLFFRAGKAIGADLSQADGAGFEVRKDADLFRIEAGHERYEVPEAVVSGG